MRRGDLTGLYARLRARFGFLDWWPGETKLEIVVGAILTQNTAWTNVEKAIANLKESDMMELSRLTGASTASLGKMIKPSGFYRQKAVRLRGILSYIEGNYGSLEKFFEKGKDELREELLSLSGIGNETADSIVLYAANKPTFVIDAYTRRIMHRLYGLDEEIDYLKLQKYVASRIPRSLKLYKDFHAQFVELAKNNCRKRPLCDGCPVKASCNHFRLSC